MAFEGIDDILKIKPVVELKEDTENHVYKADFRGHLQLVNIAEDIASPCNTVASNRSDQAGQWKDVKSSLQSSNEDQQFILSWHEESTETFSIPERRQLRSMSNGSIKHKNCIKKEPTKNRTTFDCTFPEIDDPCSGTTWEQQADNSDHSLSSDFSISEDLVILTQAEKKRLYRTRIKEENPALWSTIKEREASRKRELREKRRNVIYEMQKALEVISLPESPEFSNQQLYLEALKERYPDIWNQLVKALPDTEKDNERLFYERGARNSRKHSPKPTSMYKDVIEAQKKRIYRQRLKEERPEMYERQKARDAYARSIQRQFSDVEIHHSQPPDMKSKYISMHSKDKIPNESTSGVKELISSTFATAFPTSPVTEMALIPCKTTKSVSRACDNEHEKNNFPSEISSNSSDNLPNIYSSEPQKANQSTSSNESTTTTQSNMLWYWNDVKSEEPPPDDPKKTYDWTSVNPKDVPDWTARHSSPKNADLTEGQRLEKIEREREYLKEKRRRYRLAMSPERRAEFLRSERERLKKYRIRKKVCLDKT